MNEAESNSIIRPAGDWWEMSPPKPIIWRARKPNGKGDAVDAVLSVGEVALLSGAGGLGKSTITRLVALAGATAAGKYGDACGLQGGQPVPWYWCRMRIIRYASLST